MNMDNLEGKTPLECAVDLSDIDIVKAIMSESPKIDEDYVDKSKNLASMRGDEAMLLTLQESPLVKKAKKRKSKDSDCEVRI